jgi:ubiquinone/menaquinone biosynthesis C-methylase UbiE
MNKTLIDPENQFNNPNLVYDQINSLFKSNDISFMNHGYYPPPDFIKKENINFKNQISLYLSLFNNLDVNDKTILEIGCGRGGGIQELSKYFYFKKIDACDLNKKNIEYCIKNNKNKTNFQISNAENLNYSNNMFDVIINVESSHCYKNPQLFFNEVKRVLKPDGIFLYTDVGLTINSFSDFFYLFRNIHRKDITENVKNACKNDIENFKNLDIDTDVKSWLVSLAENMYEGYLSSNSRYITYSCSDNDKWFNK